MFVPIKYKEIHDLYVNKCSKFLYDLVDHLRVEVVPASASLRRGDLVHGVQLLKEIVLERFRTIKKTVQQL